MSTKNLKFYTTRHRDITHIKVKVLLNCKVFCMANFYFWKYTYWIYNKGDTWSLYPSGSSPCLPLLKSRSTGGKVYKINEYRGENELNWISFPFSHRGKWASVDETEESSERKKTNKQTKKTAGMHVHQVPALTGVRCPGSRTVDINAAEPTPSASR